MSQRDKLDEYIGIIETANDGEEVRDAVLKAIITTDSILAGYSASEKVSKYKQFVDGALSILWEEVTRLYSGAQQPEHEDIDISMSVMNDDLKSALTGFKNDPIGKNIRSNLVDALRNVSNNLVTNNIITLYYYPGVLDLFYAFIDLCSDDECKEAAIATSDAWSAVISSNVYDGFYESINKNLSLLSSVQTGDIARELLLTTIGTGQWLGFVELLDRIHTDMLTDYTVENGVKYLVDENAYNLEMIARRLLPNLFSSRRWWIAVGSYLYDESSARYRATVLEDLTDYIYSVRSFTAIIHDVEPVETDRYITVWYVIWHADDGYWTSIYPQSECDRANAKYDRYPEVPTFHLIHDYMQIGGE